MPDKYYSKEEIGKRISERLRQPKISPESSFLIERLREAARRRQGGQTRIPPREF